MEIADATDNRLSRIERELRLWRFACFAVAALLLIAARRGSNVVTAREFVLVDPAGDVRARLAMDAAHRPELVLRGMNRGEAKLTPELLLLGGGGDAHVAIGAYGQMAFSTVDSGEHESSVSADENGAHVYARTCRWRDRPPSARLCDSSGESKLVSVRGAASVEVTDSANKHVWSAP